MTAKRRRRGARIVVPLGNGFEVEFPVRALVADVLLAPVRPLQRWRHRRQTFRAIRSELCRLNLAPYVWRVDGDECRVDLSALHWWPTDAGRWVTGSPDEILARLRRMP
jgi:hypothetical protein